MVLNRTQLEELLAPRNCGDGADTARFLASSVVSGGHSLVDPVVGWGVEPSPVYVPPTPKPDPSGSLSDELYRPGE